MEVRFLKNKIQFKPELDNRVRERIYNTIIEEYNLTLNDIPKINQKNKKFHDYFNLDDFSVWWISDTLKKDTEIDNTWLNILFILKLCNEKSIKRINTDNFILKKLIDINFKNKIKTSKPLNIRSLLKNKFNFFYLIYRLTYNVISKLIIIYFIKLKISKFQNNAINITKINTWFKSIFPANWVNENNYFYDRHFYKIYEKKEFGLILHLREYGKKLNIFELNKRIDQLKNQKKINFFFPEVYLSYKDFIKSIFVIFKLYIKFKIFTKDNKNFNSIKMNNLNISYLIENQFYNFYFDSLFGILMEGWATRSFFSMFSENQNLITYGEFFVHNRFAYHNFKKINSKNKIISIQHSMNGKFYGATYNNRNEFSQNGNFDSINFSPAPDFYLAQGIQYKKILDLFFPKQQSFLIGSFKTKLYLKKIKMKKYYRQLIDSYYRSEKFKFCLIAPSSNDLEFICKFLKTFNFPKNWKFIISPHRANSISLIEKYSPVFEFNDKFSTIELLTRSDLLVTGFSSLAHEASLFQVPSCRLINFSEMPLYENDKNIKLIRNQSDLHNILKMVENNSLKIDYKKSYEHYYYKRDGRDDVRFYNMINKLKN